MDLPSLVTSRLDGESPRATVSLGGEDRVVVTPTRTLVYRAEGLLRDESVEAFSHEMDRLTCSVGRRKATLRMHYLDGSEDFSVPSGRFDEVLEAVLGGVFAATGVTDPEESIEGVYRFSELTVVVTDARVVKHVGAAVWDEDYEDLPFAEVTDLAFEEGNVSTQVVLEVGGRPERIKAPSDRARHVRRTLERALFDFHGVDSLAALRAAVAPDDEEEEEDDSEGEGEGEGEGEEADADAVAGDEEGDDGDDDTGAEAGEGDEERGVEALMEPRDPTAGPAATGGSPGGAGTDAAAPSGEAIADATGGGDEAGTDESGFTFGDADESEIVERLEDLEARVERQTDLIERQQETIEQLVEELRRGR